MKKITEIRKEKPYYFVSINGENLFESERMTECKEFLIKYIKEHKQEIIEEENQYDYFIGMYNIDIM